MGLVLPGKRFCGSSPFLCWGLDLSLLCCARHSAHMGTIGRNQAEKIRLVDEWLQGAPSDCGGAALCVPLLS